jgi:hypothetical protein
MDIDFEAQDLFLEPAPTPVAVKVSQPTNAITVLTSRSKPLVKTFSYDDNGKVIAIPYSNEKYFSCEVYAVNNIDELAQLVEQISRDPTKIIIRGQPV